MPRAKAASSASRICAELKIGDFNQFSVGLDVGFGVDFFFLLELLVLDFEDLLLFEDFEECLECLERERSGSCTLV